MELLRHRPLAPRKGRAPPIWRAAVGATGGALAAVLLIAIILGSKLSDANRMAFMRERIACRASTAALRKKDAGYAAITGALKKLMADPEHKTIDTSFAPFLSTLLLNGDIVSDPDYAHVVVPFVTTIADFRAGAATAEQLQAAADNLTITTQKADERLRAILFATLPQGC